MNEEAITRAADPVTPVFDWTGGLLPIVTAHHIGPHRTESLAGEGNFVPYGNGLALPAEPFYTQLPDLGVDVVFAVVNGEPGITQIRAVPGKLLTPEVLAQLPTPRSLLAEAVAREAVRIVRQSDGTIVAEEYLTARGQAGDQQRQLRRDTGKPTRGRRIVDSAFLEDVAAVYREAVSLGLPTQTAIIREFGPVSPTTARRWVVMARRQGFLGPAPADRTAGEA